MFKTFQEFIFESEDKKETIDKSKAQFDDYPASAKKDAQQALDWKKEHGDEVKAMTKVGWERANQLANGEKLSVDVISRMAQFKRHQKNSKISSDHKDEPWKDRGHVAWLGWGGDSGVKWANEKMDELRKKYSNV